MSKHVLAQLLHLLILLQLVDPTNSFIGIATNYHRHRHPHGHPQNSLQQHMKITADDRARTKYSIGFSAPSRCGTGTSLPSSFSMISDTLTAIIRQQDETNLPFIVGLGTAVSLLLITTPPSRLISPNDLNIVIRDTYLNQQLQQQQRRGNERTMKCIYKASKDGWSAINFHDKVDNSNSGAIVVARTLSGTTFGGYNPNGWRSTDDYYSSTTAFLWCYNNQKQIVKLPILPGGNCAIFDYATAGPCFGASDLIIGPQQAAIMGGFAGPDMEDTSKSAGNLRTCKSSIGSTYDSNTVWPIRGIVRLSDVEVYCLSN